MTGGSQKGIGGSLLAAVVASLALLLAPASAGAVNGHNFQVLLNSDGSGRIFINDHSSPSWEACKPDLSSCTPFATGNFSTGDAPPQTVFWAGEDEMTPLWEGNLHATSPPSVRGELRGNSVVTPVAANWAGGWEDDYSSLSLAICTNPGDATCIAINREGLRSDECGTQGGILLDPAFAGRYLRVVDIRYGSGTVFAGVGHPAYYSAPVVPAGVTTAVATTGPIEPANGPAAVNCGPDPLHAGTISRDGMAQVECRVIGCLAVLSAKAGKRTARATRRIMDAGGPWPRYTAASRLRISPAAIGRLGNGPIKMTLSLDGESVARRTVRLGRLPVVAEYPSEPPRQGYRRASASAFSSPPSISVSLNPDGSGTLTAEPAGPWEWKRCDLQMENCEPIAVGPQATTSGGEDGALFSASLDGRTLVSPPWAGNVSFAKPPTLRGTVRANEFVYPWNGDPRGGWPEQLGITQLAACRNPDGSDCITLSNYSHPCAAEGVMHPGGTVIDPILTGWYLRLAERVRLIRELAANSYMHPEEEPAFEANAITPAFVVGQIAPAAGPPTADCGVPFQMQASIAKSGTATIRCGLGCDAELVARRKGRSSRVVAEIAPMRFTTPKKELPKLRLPAKALKRLGAGKLQISVSLDGTPYAGRQIASKMPKPRRP